MFHFHQSADSTYWTTNYRPFSSIQNARCKSRGYNYFLFTLEKTRILRVHFLTYAWISRKLI